MKRQLAVLMLALFSLTAVANGAGKPAKFSTQDKCPVCGMFVAKYPDFAARIVYRDGSYAVFDGSKDMFIYLFDLKKYAPGKAASQIASLSVTDYYSLDLIDGYKAFYVTGSDVLGPMGKELVPFAKTADAEEFKRDHKGKKIVRFGDVAPPLIRELE